ncbi:hypothetical protein BDV96DRAFT_577692 [Lophiotrema nucula]|uniref:DUF6590 domain-containing protein n=1 Tax=Lophiotrema nucula TaxID=690887 RepID=A0A6A5Z5Q5_9PLEO|nr:hypothetical protein BDV96DRAFT_577692 [Lophiotrema nucula]
MSNAEYSPWIWSPEYQRHFCYYVDSNGEKHYLWSGATASAPDSQAASASITTAAQVDTTPRTVTGTSSGYAGYGYQQPESPVHYTHSHNRPSQTPSPNPLPQDVQNVVGGDLPRRFIRTGQQDYQNEEQLDPNYRRVAAHHHQYFFARGRVFKMLWTEPAGRDRPGQTRGSTHFSLVKFGETAYSEIRRFVVIQNKGTFSQCIPIQTYRRQGAKKRGLVVQDHAIIYTSNEEPELLDGEEITKQAIHVNSTRGETLESESRINFGKPYAVEHNCKVLDIGMVNDDHVHLLVNYFRQAMGM